MSFFSSKLCLFLFLLFVFIAPGAKHGSLITVRNDISYSKDCREEIEAAIVKAMDWGDQRGIDLLLEIARSKVSCLSPDDTTVGNLYHKTGVLFYMNDAYEDAIYWFNKAREIRNDGSSLEPLLNTLNGLTQSHLQLFHYDIAEELIEKQLELTNADFYKISETKAELFLADAQLAFLIEDYSRCREKLNLASGIFRSVNVNSFNHGLTLNLMGASCDLLNQPVKAIEYYNEAGKIFDFNNEQYYKALSYHNLGMAYAKLKDYTSARHFFERSFEIYKSSGDSLEIARHFIEMAKVDIALENYNSALNLASQSCTIRMHSLPDWHSDVIESQVVLGNIYGGLAKRLPAKREQLSKSAIQYFDLAIRSGMESPRPELAIEPLVCKAVILAEADSENVKMASDANTLFLRADSLVQISRLKFRHQESKIEFTGKIHHAYEFAINNSLNLFRLTKKETYFNQALSFCEKSKATAVRDKLHRTKIQEFAGIPDSLLKQERQLSLQLGAVTQALVSATDKSDEDYLSNLRLLEEVKRKLEEFDERLVSNYPQYFQLLRAPSESVGITRLQNALKKGSVMVEYFIGDDNVYIFGVATDSYNYWKLENSNIVVATVDSFISTIENSLDVPVAEVNRISFRAFQLILSKPISYFGSKAEVNNLIVVPDGILGKLPFDALVTTMSSGGSEGADYFLEKYSHSLVFSNRLIPDNTSSLNYFKPKSCAIFGIDYSSDPKLFGDSVFAVLPFVTEEVRGVQEMCKGDLFLNENATVTNFTEQLNNAEVLHLAVHGVFDQINPDASGLIFTKENIASKKSNILSLPAIYGLQMHSDLVYLSACFSGKGDLAAHEGVMSLSRAFTYAGAKSQVITLWEVSDRASAIIAKNFYSNLKQGLSKDESLRLAKLKYLDESSSAVGRLPFYWAGLVVVGNAEPMYVRPLFLWSVILFPFLLLFFLKVIRNTRRSNQFNLFW